MTSPVKGVREQAVHFPYKRGASPLTFCHASDMVILRQKTEQKAARNCARAQGREDQDGLYPCAQSGSEGRAAPDGRCLGYC